MTTGEANVSLVGELKDIVQAAQHGDEPRYLLKKAALTRGPFEDASLADRLCRDLDDGEEDAGDSAPRRVASRSPGRTTPPGAALNRAMSRACVCAGRACCTDLARPCRSVGLGQNAQLDLRNEIVSSRAYLRFVRRRLGQRRDRRPTIVLRDDGGHLDRGRRF